jgi:hypothetical protein
MADYTPDQIEIINSIADDQQRGMSFDHAVAYAKDHYQTDMQHRNDGGDNGDAGINPNECC